MAQRVSLLVATAGRNCRAVGVSRAGGVQVSRKSEIVLRGL